MDKQKINGGNTLTNNMLLEITEIHNKYKLINQKAGVLFNIFNIIGKSSCAVVIYKLLYELLNPDGTHCQGNINLNLFANNLINNNFSEQDYYSLNTYKKYPFNFMRKCIDLFVDTVNYKILN